MDENIKKMLNDIEKLMLNMPNICNNPICFCKIEKKPTEKTEVKEPEFKVGDVVVLKSGGCDMTIDEIHANTVVTCIYMNYASKFERITLSKDAIKKVKRMI